jgi:hypothetical protein
VQFGSGGGKAAAPRDRIEQDQAVEGEFHEIQKT